jgi:hypothetical protein
VIFGFNTDVRHGDTTYHVQSEARQNERLLQTQVFVRGRCIGKRALSYAQRMGEPSFSEEQMHEMLKEQHRHLVEAVRLGNIESELDVRADTAAMAIPPVAANPNTSIELDAAKLLAEVAAEPATAPAPQTVSLEAKPENKPRPAAYVLELTGKPMLQGLELQCLNPDAAYSDGSLQMRFRITDAGGNVPNAQITCRLSSSKASPVHVYATTDATGDAEVQVPLHEVGAAEAALLVQATHGSKSAVRRFRLRVS